MLRFLTLNLNYRVAKHGAWESRRALIAEAARRTDADVMALQAVECVKGHNQASELAALLKYDHTTFAAAMTDGERRRGSAFISRRPLSDFGFRELSRRPDHEDHNQRVLLRARIESGPDRIETYNAHFSWVLPQSLDNAREAVDFRGPGPSLLLGDLNSAPDSPALDTLRHGGWTDLWQALRPAEPGYTFEADRPTMRIDYALASPDLRARVVSIERVQVSGAGPPRLSDHLGLLVTLSEDGESA